MTRIKSFGLTYKMATTLITHELENMLEQGLENMLEQG
jgi:hypothetical protein